MGNGNSIEREVSQNSEKRTQNVADLEEVFKWVSRELTACTVNRNKEQPLTSKAVLILLTVINATSSGSLECEIDFAILSIVS